ncbi:MAG: hypothetical protein JZU64_04645 [Rhodoferax sp.]|jgi:hypothetical protein|nr:hypothetical protein [Rhodoferax sp.]
MSAIQDKNIAVALLANWLKNPIGPDDGAQPFEWATRADFEIAVKLALGNPELAHIFKMAATMMLNGFVDVAPDESNWLTDSFAEGEILAAFDLMHEDDASDILSLFDKGGEHA